MALRDRSTPMETYRVTLRMEERAALEQLVSQGKAAARKLTHPRVLLLEEGLADGPSAPGAYRAGRCKSGRVPRGAFVKA